MSMSVMKTIARKLILEQRFLAFDNIRSAGYKYLACEKEGDVLIVSLKTQSPQKKLILDQPNAEDFNYEISFLDREESLQECKHVVLDLSNLESCNWEGFVSVANLQKNLKQKGGKLILFGLSADVKEMFKTTQFDRVFTIKNTKEEALAEIKT